MGKGKRNETLSTVAMSMEPIILSGDIVREAIAEVEAEKSEPEKERHVPMTREARWLYEQFTRMIGPKGKFFEQLAELPRTGVTNYGKTPAISRDDLRIYLQTYLQVYNPVQKWTNKNSEDFESRFVEFDGPDTECLSGNHKQHVFQPAVRVITNTVTGKSFYVGDHIVTEREDKPTYIPLCEECKKDIRIKANASGQKLRFLTKSQAEAEIERINRLILEKQRKDNNADGLIRGSAKIGDMLANNLRPLPGHHKPKQKKQYKDEWKQR